MAQISRTTVYIGLAAVAVGVWVMTTDGGAPSKSKRTPTSTTRKASPNETTFTKEDYEASFEPVNETPRNAFRPLVIRLASVAAGLGANAVPAEAASGDPNWVYTGTAFLDGTSTALLENRVSAEAEFVEPGQWWKSAKVAQIDGESITLHAANGKEYRVRLADPGQELAQANGSGGFRPVNPALTGTIGAAAGVAPGPGDRTMGRPTNRENRDAN